MSLFNYITFAETATTQVEKQFIQQQQEHVQLQVQQQQQEQQEQVQIQAQAEQIVQKKTKTRTKKHKKHTEQDQAEEVVESIKYEKSETLAEAHETSTGSPKAETLEQIEELLPTYETLSMQNQPQDTLESVAVAVTTELSTPKPVPAQAQDDILPQKVLAISEESVALDEASTRKEVPRPEECKLSQQVEIRQKHAANVSEAETTEAPKELQPSKIPKSVKAQRKMKESRPLLVEAPSVEEAIEDLEPLKAVTQQAHGDILLSHELTEEQPPTLEGFEQLKPMATIEETVQPKLLNQEEVIIIEVMSSESIQEEATQEKPASETVTPQVTPNISVAISECQPEDSVGELQPTAATRPEISTTSVIEHKAASGSASEALESVQPMPLETQPTKSVADITFKAEEVPVIVQETEPFDSLTGSELPKARTADIKAMEHLVLTEGLLNITADSQSPIEENLPIFKTDAKEAIMDIQAQIHVTTEETVSSEEITKDLGVINIPKMSEGTLGQTVALTIGETLETTVAEMAQDLVEPLVESTQPAKGTITKPYGTAESNEEALFDSLGIVPDEDRKTAHGKVNIAEGEIVAEVQTPNVIDTEGEFVSPVPQFVDAKFDFVEQTALEVKQDTSVEKEQTLSPDVDQISQIATQKIIPGELKVTSVFEVQPDHTSREIVTEDTKSSAASEVFESMPIGVVTRPDLLESIGPMQPTQQPDLKTGSLVLVDNQQPLEVTNVQITETSTELDTLPKEKPSTAQPITDVFHYAEGLEVITMESTRDKAGDSKPSAVLAEVSMPQQYGTDIGEQAPLESIEGRSDDVHPALQTTESHFSLIQPLETSSCITLEGESVLSTEEPIAMQTAAIGATGPLQVANTSRPQHMESLEKLDDQKVPNQQAHFNIGEITLPNIEENISCDAVEDYTIPEQIVSSVSKVQIIETTTALKTSTTTTSEHTLDLKDDDIPQEAHVTPRLNDFTQKIPLSEEARVLDHVSDLHDIQLPSATSQPTISSFHEINVSETEVLEREELLEGVAQPSEQLINIALDSTTSIAVSRQEDTFEHEEGLKVPSTQSDQARLISSEFLRLPVSEDTTEIQSTGDLQEFDVRNNFASRKIDILNETKSSETIVYDTVLKSVHSDQPDSVVPQQTVVLHKHTTITGNIVFDASERFEDMPADQKMATKTQDNLSHSVITRDQSLLESETTLGDEVTPKQNAKLLEDAQTQHAKLVGEITSYEATEEAPNSDKHLAQKADLTHELGFVQTTELQQTVETEKEFTSPEQSYAVATSDEIPSRLGLPVTTNTQTVEGVDDLLTLQADERIAQTAYDGRQHEVAVSEVCGIEESEELIKSDMAPISAAESLDVMFKATPESHEERVFQKESYIPPVSPMETKARPTVDLLQSTTVSDVLTLESSDQMEHAQATSQEALLDFVVAAESNKVQVQINNLIMQKEELFTKTQEEFFGKPFIEGTQRETLITEMVPIENVGRIDYPQEPSTFLASSTSTDKIVQSHIVETQLPLELESATQVELGNIAQAKVKSDEVNVHTTVTEVNAFEIAKEIPEVPDQTLLLNVSRSEDINRAHLTTIQSTFLKEDTVPELKTLGDTAQMSNIELKSFVTEEVVGMSSIQETYELQVPGEGKANVTHQSLHEVASVSEPLTYEQTPDIAFKPSERVQTMPSSVEKILKPTESSTVNVYENVEGHGDFRPNTAKLSSDAAVPSEFKVSVVEEVNVIPSLGTLATDSSEQINAIPETVLYQNVVYSEQLPCEGVSTLLGRTRQPTEQAEVQPSGVRVVPLTSELHEKELFRRLKCFQLTKNMRYLQSPRRVRISMNKQSHTSRLT